MMWFFFKRFFRLLKIWVLAHRMFFPVNDDKSINSIKLKVLNKNIIMINFKHIIMQIIFVTYGICVSLEIKRHLYSRIYNALYKNKNKWIIIINYSTKNVISHNRKLISCTSRLSTMNCMYWLDMYTWCLSRCM